MKNVFLIISLIIIPLSQISGKTIALIQINQQAQFFTEMNRGAESAATKKDTSWSYLMPTMIQQHKIMQ